MCLNLYRLWPYPSLDPSPCLYLLQAVVLPCALPLLLSSSSLSQRGPSHGCLLAVPLVPAAVRCSELHPWRAPCSLRTALLGAPCPSSLPSDFPARAQPQLSLFLGARPPASLLFYAAVPCVWAWRSFVRDSLGQPSADVLPCRAPYPWRVFLPACVELGLCSSLCSAFCVHLPRLLSARIPARGAFPLAKIVLARCRRLVRVSLLLQLWCFIAAFPCPLRAAALLGSGRISPSSDRAVSACPRLLLAPVARVSSSVVRANFPCSLALSRVFLFAVATAIKSSELLNSSIVFWSVINFIFVMVLTSVVPIRTCHLAD
jgi:hypothetical protein